jgi:hypothetical protein
VIVCVTLIAHDHTLLPYYLEHYRRLGVDGFVIAAELGSPAVPRLRLQPDVEVVEPSGRFLRTHLVGMEEEEIRRHHVHRAAWLVPADLDEFNEYPGDLGELAAEMEAAGYTHVTGTLSDRVAADGSLAPLRDHADGVPIWDQYPLQAPVTERLAGARTAKVLLFRADLPLGIGHHRLACEGGRPLPRTGVTHHFKWRDGLAESLQWRVRNERRIRAPWAAESERLLAHLAASARLDLEALGAQRACP